MGFGETDRLTVMRAEENIFRTRSKPGGDQFITFVHPDRDNAACHGVVEFGQLRFLDHTELRDHDDEFIRREILYREERFHGFIRLQVDQIGNVFALAGCPGVGNLINLQPVDPALVGKNKQVIMGGSDQEVLYKILRPRAHADAAFAAPGLSPIGIGRGALQVAAVGYGNRNVFHLHKVFQRDLAGVFNNVGAALIAEIFLDLAEFLDHEIFQNLFGTQNLQVFADALLNIDQFGRNLVLLHAGDALELHFDDGLGLPLREPGQGLSHARRLQIHRVEEEISGFGYQRIAGFFGGTRRANQFDDAIQIVQGKTKAQ